MINPFAVYRNEVRDFELAVSGKLKRFPVLGMPFVPGGALARLRARLIEEEAAELVAALLNEDLAAVAKESADLKYVTFGTDVAYGINSYGVFLATHHHNMGKMDAATVDEGGKLIKPKGYPKLDLSDVMLVE